MEMFKSSIVSVMDRRTVSRSPLASIFTLQTTVGNMWVVKQILVRERSQNKQTDKKTDNVPEDLTFFKTLISKPLQIS